MSLVVRLRVASLYLCAAPSSPAVEFAEPDYTAAGSGSGSVAFSLDATVFGLVLGTR